LGYFVFKLQPLTKQLIAKGYTPENLRFLNDRKAIQNWDCPEDNRLAKYARELVSKKFNHALSDEEAHAFTQRLLKGVAKIERDVTRKGRESVKQLFNYLVESEDMN